MRHPTQRSLVVTVIAITLATAACATEGGSDTATETTIAITTTVAAPSTEEIGEEATFPEPVLFPGATRDLLTWSNVEYHADDEGSWTMDVYAPADDGGPWPLVVVYHGMGTSADTNEARRIAETGAVAVAPRWLKDIPPILTAEAYMDGALFDRAACATAMAQQYADEFGADASNTTVAGFSAGIHPATWVGLGLMRSMACGAELVPPTGFVSGDSQFIWYQEEFDGPLADPTSQAADTVDRFINPDRWNTAQGLAVYLWTSDYVHGREIEVPVGSDSWIRLRDTTGTLVADLVSIGALDDSWVDWNDAAQLMEMWMVEEAWMNDVDIEVTSEHVGGGHRYNDRVYDAIDSLIHRDIEG